MFDFSSKNAMNVYSKLNIETDVLAEGSHRLVISLFNSAIRAISEAMRQTEAGNISLRGHLITYAVFIIQTGLRARLNKKNGGESALDLDMFYGLLAQELINAKYTNDVKKMDEVRKLLLNLRITWL